MWLEVLSVISTGEGGWRGGGGETEHQACWFVLLLSLHAARNFKGMAAGQVAVGIQGDLERHTTL